MWKVKLREASVFFVSDTRRQLKALQPASGSRLSVKLDPGWAVVIARFAVNVTWMPNVPLRTRMPGAACRCALPTEFANLPRGVCPCWGSVR